MHRVPRPFIECTVVFGFESAIFLDIFGELGKFQFYANFLKIKGKTYGLEEIGLNEIEAGDVGNVDIS